MLAAARQSGFDRGDFVTDDLPFQLCPPPDYIPSGDARRHLVGTAEILRQLKPVDEVITYLYAMLTIGALSDTLLSRAATFCLEVHDMLRQAQRCVIS